MLNQTKTHASIEALRAASHTLAWLAASSDSAHRRDLVAIDQKVFHLLVDLQVLAERAGFHPET